MWIVKHYNELDCEYGYDPGVTVIAKNLTNQAVYNVRQYYFAEGNILIMRKTMLF